jgi:integrase
MEDGRPLKLQYAMRLFDHLREQAELPAMTLHGLRHMAASLHLAAGSEVEFVSKLLGQSNVRVTSGIYSHLLRGAGHDNADRAAALVPRAGAHAVHAQRPNNAEGAVPVLDGNGP